MSSLTVFTPPATEPVTLAEVVAHMRVSSSDEWALIAGYLIAARSWVEDFTCRALATQTLDQKIDFDWPTDRCGNHQIKLLRPPLSSVVSVSYVDTTGATQVLPSNQYQVSQGDIYGLIVEAYGVAWPSVRQQLDAITVRQICGYGLSQACPEPIRQAILIMTSHLYENREPVMVGSIISSVPFSVEALLSKYRAEVL